MIKLNTIINENYFLTELKKPETKRLMQQILKESKGFTVAEIRKFKNLLMEQKPVKNLEDDEDRYFDDPEAIVGWPVSNAAGNYNIYVLKDNTKPDSAVKPDDYEERNVTVGVVEIQDGKTQNQIKKLHDKLTPAQIKTNNDRLAVAAKFFKAAADGISLDSTVANAITTIITDKRYLNNDKVQFHEFINYYDKLYPNERFYNEVYDELPYDKYPKELELQDSVSVFAMQLYGSLQGWNDDDFHMKVAEKVDENNLWQQVLDQFSKFFVGDEAQIEKSDVLSYRDYANAQLSDDDAAKINQYIADAEAAGVALAEGVKKVEDYSAFFFFPGAHMIGEVWNDLDDGTKDTIIAICGVIAAFFLFKRYLGNAGKLVTDIKSITGLMLKPVTAVTGWGLRRIGWNNLGLWIDYARRPAIMRNWMKKAINRALDNVKNGWANGEMTKAEYQQVSTSLEESLKDLAKMSDDALRELANRVWKFGWGVEYKAFVDFVRGIKASPEVAVEAEKQIAAMLQNMKKAPGTVWTMEVIEYVLKETETLLPNGKDSVKTIMNLIRGLKQAAPTLEEVSLAAERLREYKAILNKGTATLEELMTKAEFKLVLDIINRAKEAGMVIPGL